MRGRLYKKPNGSGSNRESESSKMHKTTSKIFVIFAATVLLTPLAVLHAQSLTDALASAPVIHPQPDGVLALNVEAAAIAKWNGKQALLVNGGGGMLRVDRGRITYWTGDVERPTWRIQIASPGLFRVVSRTIVTTVKWRPAERPIIATSRGET